MKKTVYTVTQTHRLIKQYDPDASISIRALREAIARNELPHRKVGNRTLLSLDDVCTYFGFEIKED